ncbi:MAG: hypothetical protein HZB51_07945 [Chloroflexi bacterium]|nr:hypothetical protein [Chloroflexota bacterium]
MDLQRDLPTLLAVIGIVMLTALVLALVFLLWVAWRIKRINLPAGADFMTALRALPLRVAITLDLLDLGLDVFSAPVAWFLLDRLGLAPLRGVAAIKGLIPLNGMIPAMTVAWALVRVADRFQLVR